MEVANAIAYYDKATLQQLSFKLQAPSFPIFANETAHFKKVTNYLNTNIYSYLETSGGQSSNLYLNVVHLFNTSVN
jgi:hypothetical protein